MTNEEAIKILSHTSNLGYGVVIEVMEGHTTREIKMALDKAIETLEEERPQGEWINTSPYDDKGECSLCCYLSKKYYKFCPYCGSAMQNGGAE